MLGLSVTKISLEGFLSISPHLLSILPSSSRLAVYLRFWAAQEFCISVILDYIHLPD